MMHRFLFAALFALLTGGCSSVPGDLTRMIEQMERDPPESFESVLNQFVAFAQAGDIDGMLSITSEKTLALKGRAVIEQLYRQDISRALQKCGALSQGGENVHISAARSGTGSGWSFTKSCTNPELTNVRLRFVVLREQSRIVVTSVGAQ